MDMIVGDFNGKIRKMTNIVGKFELGERNDRGVADQYNYVV